MLSFDILEVAISTYLQLYRSSIVTNDNALFVHLQGTDCPHLHDRAFYCMIPVSYTHLTLPTKLEV